MTEEAQRIAIAEAHGWTLANPEETRPSYQSWWPPGLKPRKGFYSGVPMPDYLHDLNAMHEAEASLSSLHRSEFARWLTVITSRGTPFEWRGFGFCHASPPERAEAFLRVLGKWVD